MSIDYHYANNLNCLLLRFRDALTSDDFATAFGRAAKDTRVPLGYLRFSDLRGVDAMPTVADIRSMALAADQSDAAKPPMRSAILVGQDHHFGLARLFHAHRGPTRDNVNIFREYDEATRWLGLPEGLGDLFDEDGWNSCSDE